METDFIQLTVVFDEAFWIGLFERYEFECYSVAKVIFGAEPTEVKIYQDLLSSRLRICYSNKYSEKKLRKSKNPKRRQREAQKELQNNQLISKAKDALQLQLEQRKERRKKAVKACKEEINQYKFMLKQAKKREKHRGH